MAKQLKKAHISQQTVVFPGGNKVLNTLKTQIGPKEKTIVALSGGSDSMLTAVLVYNFFITNKYSLQNLFFIHFNHKVRPESDQEKTFIKSYCSGTNLICISKTGTKKTANEMNLRNRRYAQLQKIVKKNKINSVILGHNLSDRIESTFLNLLRGAGLKGFISMEQSEEHHLLSGTKIIRPLLDLAKSTITEICKKNNIPYVTDASNYNNETSLRNKLRNKVLPELFALSKSKNTKETFENSMLNVYHEIETLEKSPSQGDLGGLNSIKQSPYRKAKFAYQWDIPKEGITIKNIISLLTQLGIYTNVSSAFLNELLKFFTTANNGHKYFQKTYFFIAHGKIYIIQAPENFRTKTIKVSLEKGKGTLRGRDLRYPQPGDKYKGKTRNQYCITQKIPLFRRNFTPVLEKDGKIVNVIKQI